MATLAQMTDLAGQWSGRSRLWLAPGEPSHDSDTTARIAAVSQGQHITIAYTWDFDGEPQDGLIIFGLQGEAGPGPSVWLDSWHMAHDIMVCEAADYVDGTAIIRGSYAAPPGPDWGWRIEVEPQDLDNFTMRMFNIMPDGQEVPAVQANYERAS